MDVHASRFGRLRDRFVVDRQVVEEVLRGSRHTSLQPVAHDVAELFVGVGRVMTTTAGLVDASSNEWPS